MIYLNKNIEYKYLSTLSKESYIHLLNNQRKYLENLKKLKTPQRGSIITKDNIIYYIYGEQGQNFLTFRITQNINEELDTITICNKNFCINYENINISKQDKYEIISCATEEEIDNIKNHKKNYIKNLKKQNVPQKNKKFQIGDIIEHIYYKNQRFIIVNRHNNKYYCLAINKLIEGIYEMMIFNKKDIRMSKNKSIKGIIWLENNQDFNLANLYQKIDKILEAQQLYLNDETLKRKIKTLT